jgi:hypothetical protein
MKQAFYPINRQKDINLLTGLLRMSNEPHSLDNDNHPFYYQLDPVQWV